MKTILFLHGFFASGSCIPANALRELFKGKTRVLTPDLPIHPQEALAYIQSLCLQEKPDLLVGNSCGSFYAQIVAPIVGIPALLGNPYFIMTDFLTPRIGAHQYKSPRQDGKQNFVIDEQLIQEFEVIQQHQFDHIPTDWDNQVIGLFGEKDPIAHFEPLFLEHYTHTHHFPGAHTPTAEEVKDWYVPLIEKMLGKIY